MTQNKKKGGPAKGTPSPLKGMPSPLKGRRYPHLWRSGSDPNHHKLWRRFLLARNQAKHWHQEWSVSWTKYRDTMLPHVDNMGRKLHNYNLVRIDRAQGWHESNVMAAQRHTVVNGQKLGKRTYLPPQELRRRRENMERYKQQGYKGKRWTRYDTEV